MHSCWLDTETAPVPGAVVALSAEEGAHVARVVRMRPGDAVRLMAAGGLYTASIEAIRDGAVTLRVAEELPSPECPVRVTLAQGLPKLDKLEWIVQKATELGAWDVLPLEMERSVARLDGREAQKRERLARIALEAAKQSGSARAPEVRLPCRFADGLAALAAGGYDAVLVAWELEGALKLSDALKGLLAAVPAPRAVALVVGPEGGITEGEIQRLTAIGARCVTLGKRILRTETAGLCALSVAMAAFGEL